MAITYARVQSKTADADPAAVTLDATPIEGNLLVAHATERSGGDAANFTISGAGWTKQIAETTEQASADFRRTHVAWWKVVGASEPKLVSVDDGTANTKRVLVEEYEAGAAVTWSFESSVAADTGTGSTSPLASGDTASTSGTQLLVGSAIWRNGSGDPGSVAFTGLSTVVTAPGGTNGRTAAAAFAQTTTSGVKSTELSWTGSGHEANVALLVFSATEDSGTTITPAAVTVTASPGALTITTGAVDVTPDPVTVTASAGTLSLAVGIVPDPVTVTAAPGSVALAVDIPLAGASVTAAPGGLTVTTGAVITPEAVAVTAAPGTLVLTQGLAVVPAAVTVTATAGSLTITTGVVDITPAAAPVTATPGAVAVGLTVAPAATAVTATPGSVTVATGAAGLAPAAVTVTATPGTVTVARSTQPGTSVATVTETATSAATVTARRTSSTTAGGQ